VYAVALLLLSIAVSVLLFQISGLLAILFVLVVLVFIPALELQRREAAITPEWGLERESRLFGLVRLAREVGVDLTGIALGVVLFLLLILLLVVLAIRHVR
jgi:hypothetical protein